jgi:hypothetical protein
MKRILIMAITCALLPAGYSTAEPLRAGFAATDITPKLGDAPVFVAGFGHNRRATAVADPLMARCIVLQSDRSKIAIVSVDLIGFFHEHVERVRKELTGFDYVLVSSTHNHEGPDTLGLWGQSPFHSGVDAKYIDFVVAQTVSAVRKADTTAVPVKAKIASVALPDLLHDGRPPIVKHDELVALQFVDSQRKTVGVVIQWNCHPETLSSKNTKLSADYVGYTVAEVQSKIGGTVVYLTGTVGGLMTSLHVDVRNERGELLKDGTFEKTEKFGRLVGEAAVKALAGAADIDLTPFQVKSQAVYLPVDNRLYRTGWQIGVLKRASFVWNGDVRKATPATKEDQVKSRICIRTEIAALQLGNLSIAAIPGEIYPELVLDKIPDPAPEGADFPNAPREPAIYKQLPGKHRMLIGLANDEIGYILPKRQWDEIRPYTYSSKSALYGEINSLGSDTAPLLCEEFRKLVAGK